MDNFIMVHPNNKLTRMDKLTIPSVNKYKKTLEAQLKQIRNIPNENTEISKQLSSEQIQRLVTFKIAELRYVDCYLKILTCLESICSTCQISDSYDYEKEDEILNDIEDWMKELRQYEKSLSVKKTLFETDGASSKNNEDLTDDQRRKSLVNLEDGLYERIGNLQI